MDIVKVKEIMKQMVKSLDELNEELGIEYNNEDDLRCELAECAMAYERVKEKSKEHLEMYERYNSLPSKLRKGYDVKTTDAWCAIFLIICMMDANIDMESTGVVVECSCERMRTAYKDMNLYYTDLKNMRIGDIVFFSYNTVKSRATHVGLVIAIYGDGSFLTMEGNKNDKVQKVFYENNDSYIMGYASPFYEVKP